MSAEPTSPQTKRGPTGFITDGQGMLVVEDGSIYKDGELIGFFFEDGYIKSLGESLDNANELILIDTFKSWQFKGIDAAGAELSLPDTILGPTGDLQYNGRKLAVLNGRIVDAEHHYLGQISDEGDIYLRNSFGEGGKSKLDATTLLNFTFDGTTQNGQNCQHQFSRPLHRLDRSYSDNEIMRYFDGFEALPAIQKKYVLETMSLWAHCGLLQVVRKSEGDASLGNVKHGVTGVTRIRSGKVSLDKEEFEREVTYYKQHGPMMTVSKNMRDYLEVRLNLVVPHEFGHQVDFVLASPVQEKILQLYEKRKKSCDKLHVLPANFDNTSEYLLPPQIENRHFISGYAKSSAYEYWAESLAAFSIRETRLHLQEFDPGMYEILKTLVLAPTQVLSRVFHETISALQASLKLGGELSNELL